LKIPAFKDTQTTEAKIRAGKSPNSSNYLGIRGDYLPENYVLPEQAKSERRFTGENGQCISLSRDLDYGAQTQSAQIYIGVGYNSDNPVSTNKRDGQTSGDIKPVFPVRSKKRVASEITVVQKTDADNMDGEPFFAEGNIGSITSKASISCVSDNLRFLAKDGGIKFVTGGENIKNSAGAEVRSFGRFNFIAGNDDSLLSPVAKADTLNSALKDLYDQVDKSNSLFDSFNTAQTDFNTEITTHQHYDLTVMLVGQLAYGNPFSINGGKGLPSAELIAGGMKCLPQQYILKIDALMQKLQNAFAIIYSTDSAGPNNSASPSLFTT
tara:strand:- start:268 stop:1239 length:972 start_codon:yes stop_codon:yes gene_type:complete